MSDWNVSNPPKSLVEEHLERCVELYGMPLDSGFPKKIDLSSYEQMRADLMLAVGMLSALVSPHPYRKE